MILPIFSPDKIHVRKTGNWHKFAAVREKGEAPTQLQLFWDRFRFLRPEHKVFEFERTSGLCLNRTLPMMMHGDEGRSKKRAGVLCVNCHCVLGTGVQTKKKRKLADLIGEQQMNYSGASHITRLLLSVLPKFYYDQTRTDHVYESLMDFLSADIGNLVRTGVTGPDGLQYYVAMISCKGDWPFLHKVAGLNRSFYNQPKQAQASRACSGICHLCLAGRPEYPFEDLSPSCEWQFSLGVERPWIREPVLLKNIPHDESFPELFFHPDPWHSWHLGEGRNLVCNAMKLLLEITPGRNVDVRLEYLFGQYKSFCSRERTQCYCTKFTENLFGLTATDYPSGSWTKGNFTTSLVKWVTAYLHDQRNNFLPGSLHVKLDA